MKEGIYHVTFSSNSNDFGEGIVVLKGNALNGGDHGYLYTGSTNIQVDKFSFLLKVKQWNPAVQSVFGPLNEFNLNLNGQSSPDGGFLAQGYVVEQPQAKITIHGRYLSAAA